MGDDLYASQILWRKVIITAMRDIASEKRKLRVAAAKWALTTDFTEVCVNAGIPAEPMKLTIGKLFVMRLPLARYHCARLETVILGA
jgi:hypothetical protein